VKNPDKTTEVPLWHETLLHKRPKKVRRPKVVSRRWIVTPMRLICQEQQLQAYAHHTQAILDMAEAFLEVLRGQQRCVVGYPPSGQCAYFPC